MRIVRKHNMTQDAAKAAVDDLVSGMMQQFGDSVTDLRYAWQGRVFEFSGRRAIFKITGRLQVTDADLILDVQGIPFFGERAVRAQLEQWFSKNWPN